MHFVCGNFANPIQVFPTNNLNIFVIITRIHNRQGLIERHKKIERNLNEIVPKPAVLGIRAIAEVVSTKLGLVISRLISFWLKNSEICP